MISLSGYDSIFVYISDYFLTAIVHNCLCYKKSLLVLLIYDVWRTYVKKAVPSGPYISYGAPKALFLGKLLFKYYMLCNFSFIACGE